MKKRYFLFLLTSIFCATGDCQNIINGDFEINSAPNCLYNLTNTVYNNSISNSWGFGNNSFSGLDIQETFCGYANSPSNTWFVSICKAPVSSVWTTDAFSLEINTNLIPGNIYQISYLEFSYYQIPTYYNIPIEIGLSTNPLSFGQSIYSSLPNPNVWTVRTFSFIAPNNGKYLTVQSLMTDTLLGWNFVDNFHFVSPTGIDISSETEGLKVFPDPFVNELNITIKNNKPSEIILYDTMGRELIRSSFTKTVSLNVSYLMKGIYIYQIRNHNGIIKTGKVVKE